MTTLTIPVLPCASLPDTLRFYRLLGFEVTHEQTRPNVYAATRFLGAHLHFAGPDRSGSGAGAGTCLLILPEVQALHRTFSQRLREAYGKLPLSGSPRISRMRPGQSRFTLVDVSGNSLVFIEANARDDYDEGDAPAPRTSIERALRMAARLRDFKNDDAAAARVLEVALAKNPGAGRVERARALAARAEISLAVGDVERASALRAELEGLELSAAERVAARRELQALEAIEAEGSAPPSSSAAS